MKEKEPVIVLDNGQDLNRNEERTKPSEAETFTDPNNVAQRDEYITKIDVLSKVKVLLLLGGTEFATTKQVAEYYGTGVEAIKSIIKRHRSELESDGMAHKRYSDIKKVTVQDEPILSSGVSYRGAMLFPKRAILRIGMLLRDSEIAKGIRSQLLNIEETATNKQRTAAIDQEDLLLLAMIKEKDPIKRAAAISEYNDYKDARIKEAEENAKKYEEKANKFDELLDQTGLMSLTTVGSTFLNGVSASKIREFLQYKGVINKRRIDNQYIPTTKYTKYFKNKPHRNDAGVIINWTLKTTLEGAYMISDMYKKVHADEFEQRVS